ncbi:UNVERIFIED_CONTAM: hypothetical protein Sradi_5103700 [Sesamum radiatum]|uniref:Uncharacterized protein n=1 Tax=Sesamum radiatum TaxID=300843 RepID=A0AAW2M3E1_SESRA
MIQLKNLIQISHIGVEQSIQKGCGCYKRLGSGTELIIPFSAFWLRSSVVSVLISLISDTWTIGPHDIKLIFLGGEPSRQLAAGALKRRLGVALLPWPGAPHQF